MIAHAREHGNAATAQITQNAAGKRARDEDGRKSFDYAGCLECGTCRIICGDTIVKKWAYPGPTMGVEYRFG